jgi:large subunit ribosomal protein L30
MPTLIVTQRRSSNGSNQRQLDTLRSLGLRRIGHTVQITDSPPARGMLHAVRHLVEVAPGDGAGSGSGKTPPKPGAASKSAASKSAASKSAGAKDGAAKETAAKAQGAEEAQT